MPLPNGMINSVKNPLTVNVFVQIWTDADINPPPPGSGIRIIDSGDIRIIDSGDIRITD